MVDEVISMNTVDGADLVSEEDPFEITFSKEVTLTTGEVTKTVKFREPTMRELIGSPSLYVFEPPSDDDSAARTFTNYDAIMALFFKVSNVTRESIFSLPAGDYWKIHRKLIPFVEGND